jgi:MFS family permease
MRKAVPGRRRYLRCVFFLILSLVTTAGMGLGLPIACLHAIRFFGGFASGASFVLCSAIVLDTLLAVRRPALGGFLYSGVGTGIALGGIAAGPLEKMGGPDAAWIGLALLCIPLVCVSCVFLRPNVNRVPDTGNQDTPPHERKSASRGYAALLTAYFLEGFGYIIGTTFLVALVHDCVPLPGLARIAWIVTGCAAACSAPLWRLAVRGSYLSMLIPAFVLQAVGMLLPVLSASPVAAISAGLLLGRTFMGITVLSLQYAVTLSIRPRAHTIAVMTAVYGLGQIIGPVVAGKSAEGATFSTAFIISAVSLFIGAGLLMISAAGKKG